jgi:hypothetical protein
MSKKLKLKKKKAREKSIQQKLLVRRENKQKQKKEERQEAKEVADHKKIVNERLKLEAWVKAAEGKISEELEDRIRHNIDVLKSLEEEHAAELKSRQEAREKAAQQERSINNDPHTGEVWKDSCVQDYISKN